ncbi:hypothetical protein [Haladaptatus sp. CMAA 1911]|uniref:hypothetical protein n=1 Tax=unclassified Haladaptatus TaxID=2622732 RepID=UPI00375435AF
MTHIERARGEIQQVSELADGAVRERLLSIGEGLDEPTDGDPGAHGPFDERAANGSLQLESSRHRTVIGAVLVLVTVAFWKVVRG